MIFRRLVFGRLVSNKAVKAKGKISQVVGVKNLKVAQAWTICRGASLLIYEFVRF